MFQRSVRGAVVGLAERRPKGAVPLDHDGALLLSSRQSFTSSALFRSLFFAGSNGTYAEGFGTIAEQN
jgi:hypothetical protein